MVVGLGLVVVPDSMYVVVGCRIGFAVGDVIVLSVESEPGVLVLATSVVLSVAPETSVVELPDSVIGVLF